MADISAIKPAGTRGASYNIKDATARTNIGTLSTTVQSLSNSLGTVSNNVSALSGRVTSLETDMQTVESNIQRTYFSDAYGNDPEGDYGFTDCGFTVIVDATRWIYGDNDQVIQKTYHDTWSYYDNLADKVERVGTPKVGDIIFVKDSNRLNIGGTMPTNTIIGKFNTAYLDSHYTQPTPPTPSEDINVFGSGQHVSIGTTWYSSYKGFYIIGFATVNVPSEDVEGKTDTLLIAKCFDTEA